MNPLIELKSVYAGYDHENVLENVNLKINSSDFIGVIGPNGGGKTTLLKLILGLLKPRQGIIENHLDARNYSIGYLPQLNKFDKEFPITVEEVVLSGLQADKPWYRKYSRSDKEIVRQTLEHLNISTYRKKILSELSGGELQRTLLARALVSSPKVLVLDEPDTFVDNKFERELYDLLKELNKEMTIVLVSHDVGQISSVVKTIACVNKKLHYHPASEITQEMLASYNCPIELITHGTVPHRVLKTHQ
jgi:zinc transport system ATP-binding protein